MSPQERAELARALAALDAPPLVGRFQRRRRLLVAVALVAAVVLAVWIAVLAMTLPRYYRAGGWRLAWIGFDVGLLAVFAVTAWAAWRRRQVLIPSLLVLSTLLVCDAWFDTTHELRTSGFWASLVMALVIELPIAALALIAARRLMRLTIGRRLGHVESAGAAAPPFWKVPLFADPSVGLRHMIGSGKRAQEGAGGPAPS